MRPASRPAGRASQSGVFPALLVGPLPVPLRRPGRQARRRRAAPRSAGCRTAFPASRRGCRSCSPKGVGKGRITLNEFVALTATNHAKTYGLYPKKGTIAVGSDADIAIWDPTREVTISQSLMHGGCRLHALRGHRGDRLAGLDHGAREIRGGSRQARQRDRTWERTSNARVPTSRRPPAVK